MERRKRIGRKDLKERIRQLNHEKIVISNRIRDLEGQAEELKKRIRNLGMDDKYEYINSNATTSVEVEIEKYGDYVTMFDMTEENVKETEHQLALSLVKGLMERNLIRFMVRRPDKYGGPFGSFGTIGARIDVVPWDKIVRLKRYDTNWQRDTENGNLCKKRAEFCPLEDVEPVEAEIEGGGSTWWYVCGECHGAIDKWDSFCKHCGRPVKK